MVRELITIKELSRRVKIPLSTIYKYLARGELKGVKIGRHWRFSERDISNWLNRCRKKIGNRRKSRFAKVTKRGG